MPILTSTYVVYSSRYPYLPELVTDSIDECCTFLGVTRGYLVTCLSFDVLCDGKEVKRFYGLDLDD